LSLAVPLRGSRFLVRRGSAFFVRLHSRMSRTSKILIFSVCLVAVAFVSLVFLAAAHKKSSRIPPCHENLVLIDLSKRMWASEGNKTTNDTPTWDDLRPYFPDWLTNNVNSMHWTNGRPVCPAGGIYTIGRVGEAPRCSIGGGYDHELGFDPKLLQ
jgi:hypothetical protein